MTFGKTTVHAFYLAVPSLLLLKLTSSTKAGDSKTKSKRRKRIGVGFVTFLWSFGYLVYIHYSADSGGEWKRGNIDITGLLMVLCLKTTSCAMNFEDYELKDDFSASFNS